MIDLNQIEDKEKALKDVIDIYTKDIREMKWKYIEEQYGLNKGCVCLINDRYAELYNISIFHKSCVYLDFSFIGFRGKYTDKRTVRYPGNNIVKKFNSYEDYEKHIKE